MSDRDLLDRIIREHDEYKAEIERLRRERDEAMELQSHDLARQSVVIAFLRKRRGHLVIERDEARAEIERLRREVQEARAEMDAIGRHAKRIEDVERERDEARAALRPLAEAARTLSYGTDWNNGTHAKVHGARQKLLDALPAALEALKDRAP